MSGPSDWFLLLWLLLLLILDKIAQGYVISSGGSKYLAGTTVFYTSLLKYLVLDFVLVLFAVRTIPKEQEPEKPN